MGTIRKYSIEDAEEIAESYGGRFLTEGQVIRSTIFYLWECSNGHRFKRQFGEVARKKAWCPKCNISQPFQLSLF